MSATEHVSDGDQSIETLLRDIEEFRNGISILDADLTAHIRGLEVMSNNLDEIIANLTADMSTDAGEQGTKHDASAFEERVRVIMAEMNRDAVTLRTLREEAMRLRENCVA